MGKAWENVVQNNVYIRDGNVECIMDIEGLVGGTVLD